ncbi:MAG: hypothetical protein SYC29_13985 [Planctomycetota bacterium]|nr:hypothetical protein [Planctomycetota bacterium]
MDDSQAPTHQELSRRFGFPLPITYHGLISLAFEVAPQDPWNAFEPVGLLSLHVTHANPGFDYPGHDYADTPVEVNVIGWAGVDGVHFGFIVDDLPDEPHELPMVQCYPDIGCSLFGLTLPEFLGVFLARQYIEEPPEETPERRRVMQAVIERFGVVIPDDFEAALAEVWRKRRMQGAIPTADGCGVMLREETVDRSYLDSIDWPGKTEIGRRLSPPQLLDEAGRRLATGEPGTALVVARNYRHLHWYDDWKEERLIIRRTSVIMEQAYAALGRHHLAKKIRDQTEWAVNNVR